MENSPYNRLPVISPPDATMKIFKLTDNERMRLKKWIQTGQENQKPVYRPQNKPTTVQRRYGSGHQLAVFVVK